MAGRQIDPSQRRALVMAALADGACVAGGAGLFLATGNWIWLVSGILLGAGFLLPAVIAIMRTQR
jgi:hypothetical protein